MDRAALDRRVAELAAEYGSPDGSPGVLLCERHRSGAVAFTVVEPDLSPGGRWWLTGDAGTPTRTGTISSRPATTT